jgi:hypothetical protein
MNTAVVCALPVGNDDGQAIPTLTEVTHSDPSIVLRQTFKPVIQVDNLVYLGVDGGKKCGTTEAVNFVSDIFANPVTYCFQITNKGDTTLYNVQLVNVALDFNRSIGNIPVQGSVMVYHEGKITGSLPNWARATGIPYTSSGRPILDPPTLVQHSDPSKVNLATSNATVRIVNTRSPWVPTRPCATTTRRPARARADFRAVQWCIASNFAIRAPPFSL